MIKIVTIVGARPQFIKAAAFSRVIGKQTESDSLVKEVLVHTGQHFDSNMSHVFFSELAIPEPQYNLGVAGGTHGDMTGRMLIELDRVFEIEKPDVVLVYGDTNSTLAAALSAAKFNIPVVHIEAGLRSFNRKMPEEINRVLTDHVSDLLFTPTKTAEDNLRAEGIAIEKVHRSGDIMLDAALFYKTRAVKPKDVSATLAQEAFSLVTIHRAENTSDDNRLIEIIRSLGSLPATLLFPIHPRTRHKLDTLEVSIPPNLHLIEPVGYLEMVWLESYCEMIITDSGGVQKEAFFHQKPCLTIRDETEWVELCELGVNRLTTPETLKSAYIEMLNLPLDEKFNEPLYGQGNAAEIILAEVVNRYSTS